VDVNIHPKCLIANKSKKINLRRIKIDTQAKELDINFGRSGMK
jgi:hypothetical protein